jgi:hypothetical protein
VEKSFTPKRDVAQPPLRAIVEIVGGQLKIFPIANTDGEEQQILDALRFVREDFDGPEVGCGRKT